MSRPDELIQADITTLNVVPMRGDCSRMGWATSVIAEERVTNAMETLHPDKYERLITGNGSQFSRENSNMRHYYRENIAGAHIWISAHHPQAMGKLSNMEKRFLMRRLGDSKDMYKIDKCIEIYLEFLQQYIYI